MKLTTTIVTELLTIYHGDKYELLTVTEFLALPEVAATAAALHQYATEGSN